MNDLKEYAGKWYTQEVYDQIKEADQMEDHYDLLQLTKKIQLNSTYGALLSSGFRWGLREMVGASVTYSGRGITTHMMEQVAQLLTGESSELQKTFDISFKDGKAKIENIYVAKNSCIIYGDTDSVEKTTLVKINGEEDQIQNFFNDTYGNIQHVEDKEYLIPSAKDLFSPCYDDGKVFNKKILAIYRHKVSKKRYKIVSETNKEVIVTEDHSIIVLRDGNLLDVKPKDILETDKLIEI